MSSEEKELKLILYTVKQIAVIHFCRLCNLRSVWPQIVIYQELYDFVRKHYSAKNQTITYSSNEEYSKFLKLIADFSFYNDEHQKHPTSKYVYYNLFCKILI